MGNEQAIEKKQIVKEVKTRVARGEPKQAILEELSRLYKDKVTINKQLEKTPSKIMKTKYAMYNYALSVLLLMALVLDSILFYRAEWGNAIIDFNTAISVVLDIIFFVGVLLYRTEIYSWIASRALITLLTIVISLTYYFLEVHGLVYVSLVLILISFVLGLYLGVKLCPPRIPKVVEVDIDGVEKINKTIHVFPD